jgi:nitroreductase
MSVYDLVVQRRTIRKFQQTPVPREVLERLLEAGRLAPVGGNVQPLEFVAVDDPAVVAGVFPHTRWAGYLKDGGPRAGEEPVAYLVILHNREVSAAVPATDIGIAAESITLVALDEGVASCMIGAMNPVEIGKVLGVPEGRAVALVVALGYPAETAVAEEMVGDDVKYWRDEAGVHHVPKRKKETVEFWNRWGSDK